MTKIIDLGRAKKPRPPKGSGSNGSGAMSDVCFGDYKIVDGCFFQIKSVRDRGDGAGFIEFPLCDFTCRITEEIVAEDGLNDSSYLKIEGVRSDGLTLPVVDVPIKSFNSTTGSWPAEAWGSRVFLYPGPAKKDNLRAAVQLFSRLSGDVPRRMIYRFSGWKKIDNVWHFLSASGAITATGLVETVETDLGSGNMGRYKLPSPLAGEDLKLAFEACMKILDVTPNKPEVSASLLAAVMRSPLGECQQTDFGIWLSGLTGSRKSELAAICQSFFGEFSSRTFPSNWSDTLNDAEYKSFQAKDVIFTIDDFKPSTNRVESEKQHAMAERIIRGTGNGAGRGRRTSTMGAQATAHNRSMLLVTGEDVCRGSSLLARLLVLEIGRSDVDNCILSSLQNVARSGKFSGLMARYLQYLAGQMSQLKSDFPNTVRFLRDSTVKDGFASSHPRASEIFANLLAGFETFLNFAQDCSLIDVHRANELLSTVEDRLQVAFKQQYSYQSDQNETDRFLDLIRAALSSGNGHIAHHLDQGPPKLRPFVWGWRQTGDLLNGKPYQSCGDCFGWFMDGGEGSPSEIWLEPNTVFKVVVEFANRQGNAFLISSASLWRRLLEAGLLIKVEHDSKTGKPRPTVKRKVSGRSVRVLVFDSRVIESIDQD